MTIYEQIKDAYLVARKNKHKLTVNLLSTFLGDIEPSGHDKSLPSDAETIALLMKYVKNTEETIKHKLAHQECADDLTVEMNILKSFLPHQMDEAELLSVILLIADELSVKGMKDMGIVMSTLKSRYQGSYDGSSASKLVKDVLSKRQGAA